MTEGETGKLQSFVFSKTYPSAIRLTAAEQTIGLAGSRDYDRIFLPDRYSNGMIYYCAAVRLYHNLWNIGVYENRSDVGLV